MTEKPIPFSGPMVRAILDGRKMQTRRLCKPQPRHRAIESAVVDGEWFDADGIYHGVRMQPAYNIGDMLWVRETWATDIHNDQDSPSRIAELCREAGYHVGPGHPAGPIWYQADGTVRRWGDYHDVKGKWRPSIHMPKWAARTWLEVTGVRCERLQEISEAEAIAEGAQCAGVPASLTNRGAFAKLWNQINGKSPFGSWESNPWVWVYSFFVVRILP